MCDSNFEYCLLACPTIHSSFGQYVFAQQTVMFEGRYWHRLWVELYNNGPYVCGMAITFDTMRLDQNGRYFPDEISKYNSLQDCSIFSVRCFIFLEGPTKKILRGDGVYTICISIHYFETINTIFIGGVFKWTSLEANKNERYRPFSIIENGLMSQRVWTRGWYKNWTSRLNSIIYHRF